ncbi:MAG: T9SS type A sorting domain-containing protein [Crocinitomicaceae bacterium]
MKRLIFCLVSSLFAASSFGQMVDIHQDVSPDVTENGQTINIEVTEWGQYLEMHCVNVSGGDLNLKISRLILSSSTSFLDQLCDNNLCYPMDGVTDTVDYDLPISAGDSTLFKPIFNFSDGGTASIRYYILDADNAYAAIDSVDININSVVGVEKNSVSLEVYPNPVSDQLIVNKVGLNSSTMSIQIFNTEGKLVVKQNLIDNVNSVNLSEVENGIYFYSIFSGNDLVETKKLVVKH